MDAGLIEVHQKLLTEKPEGAEHDEKSCPLCALAAEGTAPHVEPEGTMTTTVADPATFTAEDVKSQVDAAVAAAVEAARDQLITELSALAEDADAEAKIADLESKLDAATAALAAAEQKATETEQFWAEAIEAHEAAEVAAARKDERLAELAAAVTLPEEFVKENADRFAAMSDEDWAAKLNDFRIAAGKTEGESTIPSTTVLTAAREGAAGTGAPTGSMLSELGSLRHTLTDPRTL